MRLLSTFHFVVLFILSICFIFESVEGEKTREYTVAFKGSDEDAETIIEEKPQSPPKGLKQHPHAPPPNRARIHPIHEAREFLGEHNKIRKELGEPLLKWDKMLAHYARRFAGKRAVNCDMIHSLGPYGENIYWGADYSKHTAAVAVRAWAGETNNYNPMKNTCDPLKPCGHYKQIVWKTSTKLGCARVKCNSGGVYIICSYDPPGNYVGESPFDTPQSSETPSTPTSGQTKTQTPVQTPTTPTSAQKKTPTSSQKKTPSTPTSGQTKTQTPVQTPTTPTSAQKKTPSTPTSGQTKTQTPFQTPTTPTSAQKKTPSTPTSGQTKTQTPVQTPTTPTSAQKTTPTSGQSQAKTPTSVHTPTTPTSAKKKTPTSGQTPTTQTKAPTSVQTPTTPTSAHKKTRASVQTHAAQTKTPTSPSTPS